MMDLCESIFSVRLTFLKFSKYFIWSASQLGGRHLSPRIPDSCAVSYSEFRTKIGLLMN